MRTILRILLRVLAITCLFFLAFIGVLLLTLPSGAQIREAAQQPWLRIAPEDRCGCGDANYSLSVDVGSLPDHVTMAFILTEDRRFSYHFGFDPVGIARAMVQGLTTGSGTSWQGASTITQQVARNILLTSERSMFRKIKEILLAVRLELMFTKEEILQIYLNRIYFGNTSYGLETAARNYFGVRSGQLSPVQAAMLVATIKAPTTANPWRQNEQFLSQTASVLNRLVAEEVIRTEEAGPVSSARTGNTEPFSKQQARYYLDWVWSSINQEHGADDAMQYVVLTLDPEVQLYAELQASRLLDEARRTGRNAGQVSIVVMTPQGRVLAMVGGADFRADQFNRAVSALRQPGSAFKPVIYLAALERGYTPGSLWSGDHYRDIQLWDPANADHRYPLEISLHDALVQSVNTATVRIAMAVGLDNVADVAARLGVDRPIPPEPSIALGTIELSLLDLTAVFATIANGGHTVEPYGYLYARSAGGHVVSEHQGGTQGEAFEAEDMAELQGLLRDVVAPGGTGAGAVFGPCIACIGGKTGTSQQYRDAWFVGFTTDVVVGIWVGNDDEEPMNQVAGGDLPARHFAQLMTNIYVSDWMKDRSDGGVPDTPLPAIGR